MFYFDTDEHILDAIGECFAADHGCGSVDSFQKRRLKDALVTLSEEGRSECALTGPRFDALVARYIRENIMSADGFIHGGFEDLAGFIQWLGRDMVGIL